MNLHIFLVVLLTIYAGIGHSQIENESELHMKYLMEAVQVIVNDQKILQN